MRSLQYSYIFVFFAIILGFQHTANGQYAMSDNFVTDCEGTLTDSEEGPQDGQYDHNEAFTFTICVEGSESITAIFDFFATEDEYDALTVYDGPDINSPIIAELSGVISNPPILVANSGCMTFHFISDENIVATGWFLEWTVEVEEIADPELNVLSALECPLGSLDFQIDPRIPCDIIQAGNFQLIGSSGVGIASATALDCEADNTASVISLEFSDSLSISGIYNIIFNGYILNSCGDSLFFESLFDFELTDCPFEVKIVLLDQACPGDCGQIQVEIYGAETGPFDISWSHTSATAEIVDICTDSATMVSVIVENINTGIMADDEFLYPPLPTPEILNPFLSDTFCSSAPNYTFNVDIPDGTWNATHMNNQDRRYRFFRWNTATGVQQDNISYIDTNGCITHDTVFIIPIYAGLDQSVCVSESTMQLTGNNPNNGVWAGPNTTEDGVFTTTVADTFLISFTNEEGCTDWKQVFVVDNIEFSDLDTLCSNQQIQLRNHVNSLGGTWSGPGITNWYIGNLKAWQANINAWNTYYYEIEGCIDSLNIYIEGIWAGPDRTICLSTDSIQLRFAGEWEGPGSYNPIDSMYDISNLSAGKYEITGRRGGCADRFELTIVDVSLALAGPNIICYDADVIPIRELIQSDPWEGEISGEAVITLDDELFFDPSQVMGVESFVHFSTLGCMDSVAIQIEQALQLDDYSFCESGGLQTLDNQGNSGYWDGIGILSADTGLLNPAELTIGQNEVYFVTDLGCATPVSIEIVEFQPAEINNLQDSYCYIDTNYTVELVPSSGTFTINGIAAGPDINPADLGFGYHELEYTVGSGECEDRISVFIAVSDSISGITFALRDTLCPDESTSIFVETDGGAGTISAVWNQGLGFGKSHTIVPDQSTTFTVTLSDGCSDEMDLALDIHVIDTFEVDVTFGPDVCYGDSSFLLLELDQPDKYDITWDGLPSLDGHFYEGLSGSYLVNILSQESGCEQEYTYQLPGSAPLGADFNLFPNQDCIDLDNNTISIINLAFGYSGGFMTFGIDEMEVDIVEDALTYEYNDIGVFEITQIVFNELGCSDTLVREICVENVQRVFVPNIFTPDGDGVNDLFRVHGLGINAFSMRIYDRWGGEVFHTENIEESWDGLQNGTRVQQGVYAIVIQYKNQETGVPYTEYHDVTVRR